MAEAGQRDDNLVLPTTAPSKNKSTKEWKEERSRMISYISDSLIAEMTVEDLRGYARCAINERYYYAPDHDLVDKYERLEGPWTPQLEYYRPKTTDTNTTK
tara:strand:+ start:1351 stop:1653 length:303 start_codon:yes stop_codon:yes gene_type:complete